MHWTEYSILGGIVIGSFLFVHNTSRQFRTYPHAGIGLRTFIVYLEIIKTVGGTTLTLVWMASSMLLLDGVKEFFGGKGTFVAVVMILPMSMVFYALMNGFIHFIDIFPALMHENNSNPDD